MPAVNEEMVVDQVDNHDQPVGSLLRKDVFREHASFRVVHIFLFNRAGDLLLQQIASGRQRHPGYWGSSVAGYVFSNEPYWDAAQRRLEQELGVTGSSLRLLGKTSMDDDGCKKFISLFAATADPPFRWDPSHIAALELVSLSRIRDMVIHGQRVFTPTFLHLLEFYTRAAKP